MVHPDTHPPFESQTDHEPRNLPEAIPVDSALESGNPSSTHGLGKFLIDLGQTLLLSFILFAIVNLISERIRVEGYSMEPTFHDGELVIVDRLAYKFGQPQRGEVIIFNYPADPNEEFIKRIIGLPGDVVTIQDGNVSVNGEFLVEPYIAEKPAYSVTQTVPEGTLFVLGDNRNNSSDSHVWGPLPMDLVIGKAFLIYWPPQNFSIVEHVPASASDRP